MTDKTSRVADAMAKGEVVDEPFFPDESAAGEVEEVEDEGDEIDGNVDLDQLDAPQGLAEAEREIARFCALLDQNDRDNGRRLIAWFGGSLCYVTGLGWLVWRDTHWLRDEADLEVRYLAQLIVDKIKIEAFEIEATEGQKSVFRAFDKLLDSKKEEDWSATDKALRTKVEAIRKKLGEKRSKRRNWAVTSGNAGKTTAMLQQAQSLKSLPIDRLDADAMLFNCRNVTLRFDRELDPERPEGSERKIGTMEVLEHDREHLITKLADVDYDETATCPYFLEQFLARVMPAERDRRYLQVVTAYALLIAGNDAQRMVYHYGKGANGKSAFIELIGRLAGTYRSIASPETVTGDGQRQGQQANPDIARLHNTRLVTIEELPKNVPLREELVKALTGGTKILARFLNKDFFEFMPVFVPVLSGNSKPAINGTDFGIWRRLLPVLWGVTIPDEEKIDPSELAAKLDAERSGILNWLIEGLMLYLKHGLDLYIPPEVREFWQDYRQDRDNVGVFLEVALEPEEGGEVKAGVLYKAYTDWCEVNALRPATQRSFGDSLGERGLKKKRGNYVIYLDVRLVATPNRFTEGVPTPPRTPAGDPGWSPSTL